MKGFAKDSTAPPLASLADCVSKRIGLLLLCFSLDDARVVEANVEMRLEQIGERHVQLRQAI